MHQVGLAAIKFRGLLFKVISGEVDVLRATDMALGEFLRRPDIKDNDFLLLDQFLRAFRIDVRGISGERGDGGQKAEGDT